MSSHKHSSKKGSAAETRTSPRVEFWTKDGYWHFVEPNGKWSAKMFESSTDAWKASNSAWRAQ